MCCLKSRLRGIGRLAGCVLALSLPWTTATNVSPSIRIRPEPIPEDNHVFEDLTDLFEIRDPGLSLHQPSACEMGPETVNKAITLDAPFESMTPHTLQTSQTPSKIVHDHTTSSRSIRVGSQIRNQGFRFTADSQQQPTILVNPNSSVENRRILLQENVNSGCASTESPKISNSQPKPAKFMASTAARTPITSQSISHSRLTTESQAQTNGQEILKSQPRGQKRKRVPEKECDYENEFLTGLMSESQELRTSKVQSYIVGTLPHYKFTVPTSIMTFRQSVIEITNTGHEIIGIFRQLLRADSRTGQDERSSLVLAVFIDKYSRQATRGFEIRKLGQIYTGIKVILRICSHAAILRLKKLEIDDQINQFFVPQMSAARCRRGRDSRNIRAFLEAAQTSTKLVLYQIDLLYRLSKQSDTAIDRDHEEQVILAWQNLQQFWEVKLNINRAAAREEKNENHNCFHDVKLYNDIDQSIRPSGEFPKQMKFARSFLSKWLRNKNEYSFHSFEDKLTITNFFSFLEDCSTPDLIHMVIG